MKTTTTSGGSYNVLYSNQDFYGPEWIMLPTAATTLSLSTLSRDWIIHKRCHSDGSLCLNIPDIDMANSPKENGIFSLLNFFQKSSKPIRHSRIAVGPISKKNTYEIIESSIYLVSGYRDPCKCTTLITCHFNILDIIEDNVLLSSSTPSQKTVKKDPNLVWNHYRDLFKTM